MDKHKWIRWGIAMATTLCIGLFIPNVSFLQESTTTFMVTNHSIKQQTERSPYEYIRFANENQTITHEKIIQLTTAFMEKLVQDIDDDYRVIHFDTKEELLDDFEKIMSRDLAKPYIDFYYEEKADGMFIVPTETPPWFDEKKDYDMIQVNDHQVRVIQANDSVFYGHYVIELEFTWTDQWKITDIIVD